MIEQELFILANLITNQDYCTKTLVHLDKSFFQNPETITIFDIVDKFYSTYQKCPTLDVVEIELGKIRVEEDKFDKVEEAFQKISSFKLKNIEQKWLLDITEEWAKERMLYNALSESLIIFDDPKQEKAAILPVLQNALAYGFEESTGYDYLDNFESRYDYYTSTENRIPFSLEILNRATDGGLLRKKEYLLQASTHVGKTLWMCDWAASHILLGYNVLYITLEISREELGKRIDANCLDIPIEDLKKVSKEIFLSKAASFRSKVRGKLEILEYAPKTASIIHFKKALADFKIKQNFIPDVIYVDYLNLCKSAFYKDVTANHKYVGSVAIELRALAVEDNVALITATQTNRQGSKSTDPSMEDIAESYEVPGHVDLLWLLNTTEELKAAKQIRVKQAKNRLRSPDKMPVFVVGIDYDKRRLTEPIDQFNVTVENTADRYKPETDPWEEDIPFDTPFSVKEDI